MVRFWFNQPRSHANLPRPLSSVSHPPPPFFVVGQNICGFIHGSLLLFFFSFYPFFNYRSSENYSPNNSLKVFLFSDLSFIVNFQFHSQTDQITFLLLRTLENAEISYERERERDIRDVSRISLARLVDSRFHITTLLPVARDVTDRS